MTSSELFSATLLPDEVRAVVSDRAWLQAMLDFEAALAAAEARAGVIPAGAAEAIRACCEADRFDAEAIGREGRSQGNPAAALVRALTAGVPGEAAGYVHRGATSQDVIDTAAMLVARGALDLMVADLDALAAACAGLADEHRATTMAGRTLLQHALPTTFGLRAAGWLVAVLDAGDGLVRVRQTRLAVQLGGAAGTLASLGDDGPAVLAGLAEELDLAEPAVPWHTARTRVAEIGAALGVAAGALGKLALDVVLLSQTEVGEVAEASAGERGGSSTLPHKRNPVSAVLARACAQRVPGLVATLFGAMAQEHERAAGAWHAEWQPLSEALACTAGAAAAMRESIDGLEVDAGKMSQNLDATGGLVLAERVSLVLAEHVGRAEAQAAVRAAADRYAAGARDFLNELEREPLVQEHLPGDDLDELFGSDEYLGSAGAFVDRALKRYREERA